MYQLNLRLLTTCPNVRKWPTTQRHLVAKDVSQRAEIVLYADLYDERGHRIGALQNIGQEVVDSWHQELRGLTARYPSTRFLWPES